MGDEELTSVWIVGAFFGFFDVKFVECAFILYGFASFGGFF